MKHIGHKDFWKQVDLGLWEPETFSVLNRFCRPNKVFIDIGAWNGVCSLYAGSKGSICYAIEPDPEAIKSLRKNVKLNEYDIKTINCCISDTNGIVNLNTQYDNGFGNSMSSLLDRGLVVESVEVRSFTLETFIDENKIDISLIDLIKIDIEGGEVSLMRNEIPFLKRHKPNLYLSLHPAWFPNLDDDIKEIEDIIFDIYRVFDTNDRQYEKWEFLSAVNSGVHSLVLIQ